jgi:hypothetical protein
MNGGPIPFMIWAMRNLLKYCCQEWNTHCSALFLTSIYLFMLFAYSYLPSYMPCDTASCNLAIMFQNADQHLNGPYTIYIFTVILWPEVNTLDPVEDKCLIKKKQGNGVL